MSRERSAQWRCPCLNDNDNHPYFKHSNFKFFRSKQSWVARNEPSKPSPLGAPTPLGRLIRHLGLWPAALGDRVLPVG